MSSKGGSQSQTTSVQVPSYLRDRFVQFFNQVGDLQAAPDQSVTAGLNDTQQDALGIQEGLARNVLPGVTQDIIDRLTFFADPENFAPVPEGLLDEQSEALSRRIGENFSRHVLPALDLESAAVGGFGTRGEIERGLAASDAQRQIADSLTSLQVEDFNRRVQRQSEIEGRSQNAAFALPGTVPGLTTLPSNLLANVGNVKQADNQNQLLDRFRRLELLGGLLNQGAPLLGSVTTSPGTTSGGLPGLAGGAATGVALGSPFGGPGAIAGGLIGGGLGAFGGI